MKKNKGRFSRLTKEWTILLVLVLGGLLLIKFSGVQVGSGEQIYRPIWGSIGCELTGSTPQFTRTLDQSGSATVTCLGSNCKITHINQAACGFLDQRIVHGSVGYSTAYNYEELTQLIGNQGDQFKVQVRCFDPIYYGVCSSVLGAFGTLFSDYCRQISTNPSLGSIQGYWNEVELKKFQDGAKFQVSGGKNCYVASTKSQFNPLQPYDESKTSLWKTISSKTILGQLVNPYIGGELGNTKLNQDNAEYLPLGKYIPYLVEWKPISPIQQNIYKPTKGKFIGKEVICDTALNKMYQLEVVSTPSGSYKIPTKDLGSVECCNNVDCYGNYQNLICGIDSGTFKCEPKSEECQTPCISDLQCPDNVVRRNGIPYVMEGNCDFSDKCCTYTEKQVGCIDDNDCPARYGYIVECASDHTCLYIKQDQKTSCPQDCCSGRSNYYAKSCAFGLTCCWENDVWGYCKTRCDAECMSNSDCNDGNSKTKDWCEYGKCEHEWIDQGPCEEQCTTQIDLVLYKSTFIDPFCYLGCTINEAVKGTLMITYIFIKFMFALILVGVMSKVAYVGLKGKKKRRWKKNDREIIILISILAGLLSGYILWVII